MISELLLYNTHLAQHWYIYATGAENTNDYQIHHHHHLGQNRPHQKDITHPQGPLEHAEPDSQFFCGSEAS